MSLSKYLRPAITVTAPAFLVSTAVVAFQFAATGLSFGSVVGVAFCAGMAVWAGRLTYRLLGVALIVDGARRAQEVLAERGVTVSREKALEIAAAIAEARRAARERK